jgi:hypothetical protein
MATGYPDGEGRKSNVYLAPAWSAKQGTDKNFRGAANNKAWSESAFVKHTVTAGKTLYVTGLSGASHAQAAANFDHFLHVRVFLHDETNDIYKVELGGNGGAHIDLSKPIPFAAGVLVGAYCTNYANIACDLKVTFWGYEI